MGKNLKSFESFEDSGSELRSDIREILKDIEDSMPASSKDVIVTPGILVPGEWSYFHGYRTKKEYEDLHEGKSSGVKDAFEITIKISGIKSVYLDDGSDGHIYYANISDDYSKKTKVGDELIERIKKIDNDVQFYRSTSFSASNKRNVEDRIIIALP